MPEFQLHHVSIVITDLHRSVDFYQSLFGFERLERPPFKTQGAWLACGAVQIHLIQYPPGTFRTRPIDTSDGHFCLRTDDFDGVLAGLVAKGFREDGDPDDPSFIVVIRNGAAPFPQLYLRDPDRNIVEINGAPARHG